MTYEAIYISKGAQRAVDRLAARLAAGHDLVIFLPGVVEGVGKYRTAEVAYSLGQFTDEIWRESTAGSPSASAMAVASLLPSLSPNGATQASPVANRETEER
jgi:hypothetical protein